MVKKKVEEKSEEDKAEEIPEYEKLEEKIAEPEVPKELEGFDELMNKSVAEITAIAEEKGLNAKDYLTKDDAVKAILEAIESEKAKE